MLNNVIILADSASFPWGMAASNRVRNLAKGIMSSQWTVEYIGLRGADVILSEYKKKRGVFDGIKYFYPGGSPVRSNSWWMRRMDDLLGTCLSVIHILYQKFTGKVDAVIIYSMQYHTVLFWSYALSLLHIPVVLEVCEWPIACSQTSKRGFRQARKFCFNALPKVDAVLPISQYIDNEIRKIAESKNKNIPSLIIPILIDIDPVKLTPAQKSGDSYLLYSGYIGYMENAKIVIDILHELKCRSFNLHVKFTGSGPDKLFDKLKQYASEIGVLHQIEFTGFLEDYELYRLMQNALALLAPLPENSQTEARFPTKLGYYLASGSPVITNAVGDVGLYIKDGVNAFVAQKCNPCQFATKIEEIINDPILASEVGRKGTKLAFESFHYTAACKGLCDFLQEVITNYK